MIKLTPWEQEFLDCCNKAREKWAKAKYAPLVEAANLVVTSSKTYGDAATTRAIDDLEDALKAVTDVS